MKLPLSWLRDYVDISLEPAEFASRVTDAIAEVEGWEVIGEHWDPELVRVAEVLGVEPHPNADRLRLATVNAGEGPRTVVCGAPNVAAGQKVAFATEGAMLVDGHTGKLSKLKLRAIRGVDSAGMVLSEKELGLSDEHEGILVLPEDSAIGSPLVEAIGDVVFDVSTWANRADLLGILGFAREVAAVTGQPLREPDRAYTESGRRAGEFVSVSIEAPDLCRRFTASIIEGIEVGPSPPWMQQRLMRAGMRPINNVVDVTNYVMLETGQPLHAFDYELVRGAAIRPRRARPGERLTTLDGVQRDLDPDMLMICDGEGPVAVAGIMGGGNSEVSESTTTVLLEVANFHPGSIRRTSTQLRLRSEASLRFEKGIGPDLAPYAQARALHLLEQVASGRPAAGLVDVFPTPLPSPRITLEASRIEQVLGIAVEPSEVRSILGALGFEVAGSGDAFEVTPPYWRPDVAIPDDLIEELIRVHGYERLPTTVLRGALPEAQPRPLERVRERARSLAAGLGFQEVVSYTLTSGEVLDRVVAPDDDDRAKPLAAANPVASQHTYLRTSLRGSLLTAYAANRHHEDAAMRLFEIGVEYLPTEADLPHERPVLCAVLGGQRLERWVRPAPGRLDFFDAKGAVEALLDDLGVAPSFTPEEHYALLSGHTAAVSVGDDRVGVVAQVHPDVATAFDIEEPVFLVELWFEPLTRAIPERPDYVPPSRYPEARRDLALLVPAATPASALLDVIRSHRARGVRISADVFDEYRGEGVPAGQKSLALAVRFRADDRTLGERDVVRIEQGLLRRLEQDLGATLRA